MTMATDAHDWPAVSNGAGPSIMKRGRRQDNTLPPSRSREIQRAFRQRRADYIAGLEQRVRNLEAEADGLRSRLGEPSRYDLDADVPQDGPQPLLRADDPKSRGRAKAYLTSLGFQLRGSGSLRGSRQAGKVPMIDEGSADDDDDATPSPLSPSGESHTRSSAAGSSPRSAHASHHGFFGSPGFQTFPTPPPLHQPSPVMTYTAVPPPPAPPPHPSPSGAVGPLPPQDPTFTSAPYHHGYPVPMGWRPAPNVGQHFGPQTMSTPAVAVPAYESQYVEAHQYPIPRSR